MSEQVMESRIPVLTLGWRLKMSLGDIPVHEIATDLGVSRATISRWMADKGAAPRRAYIAQWSLITGTDRAWLETGIAPTENGGGNGDGADDETRTRNILLGMSKVHNVVLYPDFGQESGEVAA